MKNWTSVMSRMTATMRRMQTRVEQERGMALMLVLMIMMLLSALMIGFMASIMADSRSSGVDRDETQAYAVAHAGMEKLTSDLASLFLSDYSPNGTQITTRAAVPPSVSGFTYTDPDGSTGYKVQFTAKTGTGSCPAACTTVSTPTTHIPVPDQPTTGTTIAAGPYQGFKGLVTHYNIMVTAKSSGGAEIRMRRELQTVAVPVFQFGLFSESSLSFHAGADFNFGGRIHTNGDLFLTSGDNTTLTLSDKVTAVGEIVRKYLDSGILASNWEGTVKMAKGTSTFRNLELTEGSVTGGLPPAPAPVPSGSTCAVPSCINDPAWTNLSIGDYNGYIRNGRTGAKRLDLPLVAYGAQPIDLIRRPPPPVSPVVLLEPDTAPLVYNQRYYSQASLRILLSDTAADLTSLPFVTGSAVSLEAAGSYGPTGKTVPLATSAGGGNYRSSAATPLIGGFIKADIQKSDGTWIDATPALLALGIAGRNISNGVENTAFIPSPGNYSSGNATKKALMNACLNGENVHPNAVIRLQRVKDVPSTAGTAGSQYECAVTAAGVPMGLSTDYWPLALYDAREGMKRDEAPTTESANNDKRNAIAIGGVMYYVELDVANLAKWFKNTATGFTDGIGVQAKQDNNGYIVYFSDRRNNRNGANKETGEFGNEDIINPTSQAGTPNNTLDAGEDVNAFVPVAPATYTAVLDTYGTAPKTGTAFGLPAGAAWPLDGTVNVNTVVPAASASAVLTNASIFRGNRPIFFRRALKLTGGKGLAGSPASPISGLTIASENPVYVEGNYNVSVAADFATENHIAAAVIADAIILLSSAWNDVNSFTPAPNGVQNKTAPTANDDNDSMNSASSTSYRFAAVSGKSISFQRSLATWTSPGPETDFGNDGGAHNLMRMLEDWGGNTLNYRGSIVSFFISRQATGIYKAGSFTYGAPGTRNFNFDVDFLLPDKLPPGTPMFRDVNTLTFRQLLRPNQ